MAESNLVRFVTADPSQVPQPRQLQSVNLGETLDITAQSQEEQRQNVHRAYQAVRDAMTARSQANAAALEAQGRSTRGSELAGLAQVAAQGLQIFGAIEAKKLEQEQAAGELAREEFVAEQSLLARTALQDSLIDLQERIRTNGLEQGINITRMDVDRIIETDFRHLPAETRQALREFTFTPLKEAEQQVTTRLLESQLELRNTMDAARRSELQLGISAELQALTHANDVATSQGILNQAIAKLTEQTPDLSPIDRIALVQPILENITTNYMTGEAARQEMIRVLNGMAGFQQQMSAFQQSGMLQNPNQASILGAMTATSLGVPELADNWMSDSALMEQALNYQRNVDALQQMQFDSQNQWLAQEAPEYLASAATRLAWNWYNETSPGDAIRRDYVRDNPERATEVERRAVAVVDRWQEYQNRYHEIADNILTQTQYQQRVALRRDPSLVGETRSFYDPALGRYNRTSIVDENGVLFLSPEATEEEYRASIEQVRNLQNELQQLVGRAQREGFNPTNPGDASQIAVFEERMKAQERAANAVPEFRRLVGQPGHPPPGGGRTPFPNFNGGQASASIMPPIVPLYRTEDGMPLPLAHNRRATITSEYGTRTHPVHGGVRMHHGMDISPDDRNTDDVGAVSVAGGEVINVDNWNGYGGTVMVRTASGHVEQYSHLRSFNVQVGQTIPPGTPVGVIGGGRGDRMAGTSTGRHLHFQVWRPQTSEFGNPNNDTVDPQEYLRNVRITEQVPYGLGLPPNQPLAMAQSPSPASMPTGMGMNWLNSFLGFTPPWLSNIQSGTSVPAERVATPTNPLPQAQAPIHRSAYPPRADRNANYGYRAIAADPDFGRAIAEVADELNIPGQWLADVMAFESTTSFNPNVENSIGAIGLIQVIPATYRALGVSREELLRMSRGEYMRRVTAPYLREFKGRLNTVEDLLASIFGGTRLLARSPQARASIGDGNISFRNYTQRLGNGAGRRYRTSYDVASSALSVPHSSAVVGCATCQAMTTRFNDVVPHEAPP
jgi:murein DD-endopeptidase MepM/ murein hydrolase activator NlpD